MNVVINASCNLACAV